MNQPQTHLPEQALARLRARIEQERERLQSLVRSAGQSAQHTGESDPVDEEPRDYADQGLQITTEDTELALSENDQVLLDQVERALARLGDGTYGFSEVTGKPIPLERLEILPWATTNVDDPVR